jgi:formate hydrogenlyase subunit 3/multisubunit Na+/H+ antiporter MnhD subunit
MMADVADLLLPLMVALPLAGAFLALALGRFWTRAGRFLGEFVALLTMLAALTLAWMGVRGSHWAGSWNPLEITRLDVKSAAFKELLFTRIGGIALCADDLALLMLLVIGVAGVLVAIYAAGYTSESREQNRFYALLLLMLAGMNGCAISADFFNFFVFLELASVAAYGLVACGAGGESLEAAFKYLAMGAVGALLMLLGVGLIWGTFGALNFGQVAVKLRAVGGLAASPVMLLVAALFVFSLALKGAMAPCHAWMSDVAPAAPAPAAAMISGVAVKVLGLYAIARVFLQVFEAYRVIQLAWALVAIGVLSMVVGALMAAGQWDLKRLLAYSGIGQTGYVVLALGVAMLCMWNIGRGRWLEKEIGRVRLELTDPRARLTAARDGLLGNEEDLKRVVPEGVRVLKKRIDGAEAYLQNLELRKKRMDRIPPSARRLALALLMVGALLHLLNCAAFKTLLMLCAGAIEKSTGTRNLKELGGLWQRMPVTSATCAIGSLSMGAVPPLGGFWGLLLIVSGCALAGHWVLAAIAVFVAFVTLVSVARLQKYALFGPMSARVLRGTREAHPSMCFSMVALAAACVLLGVLVLWVVPGMITPAAEALQAGVGAWNRLLGPLGVN